MRKYLLFIFLIATSALSAQEICDNGVDDDGNGLIDLQDESCECSGLFTEIPAENLFSNPGFEDFNCCPTNFAQIYCDESWQSLSTTSPDLYHECDYLGSAGLDAGILPPPSGDGASGIIISPEWQEYLKTCLSEPLAEGLVYTFEVDIASSPANETMETCAGGDTWYGDLELTLFGSTTCSENPQIGFGCPLENGPGWQVLGSVSYSPGQEWSTVGFSFTTDLPIQSLALGGPCELPDSYQSIEQFCYPYFYFDDLVLTTQTTADVEMSIDTEGNLCDDNATLTATIDAIGGSWQWYLDAIALAGETSEVLNLSEAGYGAGEYTAVYFLDGNCQSVSTAVTDQSDFTATSTATICANEVFVLPDGSETSEAGTYQVFVENGDLCDSLLTVDLSVLPIGSGNMTIGICPGESVTLDDGQVITAPGTYTVVLSATNGCDSLVTTTVEALDGPTAAFNLNTLGFFPDVTVQVQNESTNAIEYLWEFQGGTSAEFEPQLQAGDGTGEVCLTVTSANECTDQLCLTYSVIEDFSFYCPNAFTPDNDGVNETFGPVVRGYDPDSYRFEIWNRWGDLIFVSTNPDQRWIGNDNGGDYYVPDGVYTWQARVKPLAGAEVLRYTGHVVVLR
jgi:PKD repeat protein